MADEKQITQQLAAGLSWLGTERRTLSVFFVRYVPQAMRGGFVNIAVIMIGDDFADMRIVRDWKRVLAFNPDADIELLSMLMSELSESLRLPLQREEMLLRMKDSWSNAIQISQCRGCLADDPNTELETLASLYLD